MYLSLIVTFLLLLVIVIFGIQNTMPSEVKFIVWKFQLSLTVLIFYSSIVGAAIVAILSLPKLVSKHLKARKLSKEVTLLKKRAVELEKKNMELEKQNVEKS
ncbi:MAG: lipopolysaccharide assembly protein LapA domain-containing protein [Thermodesulfobacteriota bacterium]|nr:lipopolysaccharide assembly protein LapA domain-containing protein [Thermodesulfobacteriota bacterium]